METKTGSVKWFNDAKGFGSIVPEMGGIDLNVHISGLIDQIAEGHRVKFCIEDKSGVKYATHVTVI